MQEIIISPEITKLQEKIKKLYDDITSLILLQNELMYEKTPRVMSEYMNKIGHIEEKINQIQVKCLKIKHLIFRLELRSIFGRKTGGIEIKPKSPDERPDEYSEAEIKNIYRFIMRKLHPDTHAATESEKLLLINTIKAYESKNKKALENIKDVVETQINLSKIKNLPTNILLQEYETLTDKHKDLLQSIKKIKASFPLNQQKLLANKKKTIKRQLRLNKELEDEKLKLKLLEVELTKTKEEIGEEK